MFQPTSLWPTKDDPALPLVETPQTGDALALSPRQDGQPASMKHPTPALVTVLVGTPPRGSLHPGVIVSSLESASLEGLAEVPRSLLMPGVRSRNPGS